jgi:hypothetical protein
MYNNKGRNKQVQDSGVNMDIPTIAAVVLSIIIAVAMILGCAQK